MYIYIYKRNILRMYLFMQEYYANVRRYGVFFYHIQDNIITLLLTIINKSYFILIHSMGFLINFFRY